jgi:hypothetical protein
VAWDQLVSRASLGVVDEDQFVYGTRIQLLLDSQPVYKTSRFQELTADVLSRVHRSDSKGHSDWTPLLCELMRYWRSLCSRTFWISPTQPGVLRTITTKLNHSRLVLIAGLLCLLGEASAHTLDSRNFLQTQLRLTPLERLLSCSTKRADVKQIVASYDQFLSRMSDRDFLTRLNDPELTILETSEFLELDQNAKQLKTALLNCIVDRSHVWPTPFRESLIL